MLRIVLFLLAALVGISGVAQADDAGPQIQGTLATSLSSATANVGDRVVVANLQCDGLAGIGYPDASCTGGHLVGQVTKVQRAGQGVRAQLEVQFSDLDLRTPQGITMLVGVFQIAQIGPQRNTGREMTGALVGAAAGALLGKLFGGKPKDVVAGAVAGAAGGYLLEANNREDIQVAQDQPVKVFLKSVTRTQSRP